MQLHRTMYSLKEDNLVNSWDVLAHGCANVHIVAGKTLTIFIGDKYYGVGYTEIHEAYKKVPNIQYVILNSWQEITGAAEEYCVDNNIKILSYVEFRKLLHTILGH